eukprot:scaffold306671_cov32-Tisochrysis_lutea.AAC.1
MSCTCHVMVNIGEWGTAEGLALLPRRAFLGIIQQGRRSCARLATPHGLSTSAYNPFEPVWAARGSGMETDHEPLLASTSGVTSSSDSSNKSSWSTPGAGDGGGMAST